MSQSKRRRFGLPLFLIVLAIAAYFGWQHFQQAAPKITYKTATVERGRVAARVTASGTLSPLVNVQVGSQVSGRIAELFVDFNSPVKKGQVLAKLDPQLFQAAVDHAKANHSAAMGQLAKAQANATNAKKNLERMRELAARKLIAEAELDIAEAQAISAEADVQAAKGAVEQTRASLKQAQVNLGYTTIVSPVDGVVISRNVDVGQTVAASLQAPVLFEIAEDLARMQVNTSVAEADVGKLRPGMTATFTVDAYPQETFRGVVRQIRNAPTTVQNVVTYDAVIDVENPELKLLPGMTANVTFLYAQKNDAVLVPNAALRFRPPDEVLQASLPPGASSAQAAPAAAPAGQGRQGRGERTRAVSNKREVWVLRGEKLEKVAVTTGITDGTVTEIVEGEIQPGDAVVIEANLAEGAAPKPAGGDAMRRFF